MKRIRVVIDVDVPAPSQHEMRDLTAILLHEAPQFVNETFGTVFADQHEFQSVIVSVAEDIV